MNAALEPGNGDSQLVIDQRVYDLYDEYCHGHIDRREFLARARALVISGVSALAMAQALFPRYAEAQVVSFTDNRIKAKYVDYASPGGNSGKMRGYLVQPAGAGPFPAVIVFHENRGLNPYIEDVARRAAVAGFLALAPDGLAPVGGYPGNDDDGRALQSGLDQAKLRQDMVNSAQFPEIAAALDGQAGCDWFLLGRRHGQQPRRCAGLRASMQVFRSMVRQPLLKMWGRSRQHFSSSTRPPMSASMRCGRRSRLR